MAPSTRCHGGRRWPAEPGVTRGVTPGPSSWVLKHGAEVPTPTGPSKPWLLVCSHQCSLMNEVLQQTCQREPSQMLPWTWTSHQTAHTGRRIFVTGGLTCTEVHQKSFPQTGKPQSDVAAPLGSKHHPTGALRKPCDKGRVFVNLRAKQWVVTLKKKGKKKI